MKKLNHDAVNESSTENLNIDLDEESDFDNANNPNCSWHIQQAILFSSEFADVYATKHYFKHAGMTPDATATVAMGRLEYALRKGRQELAGIITEEDFNVLCNTFQGEIAAPSDFKSMASDVANEFGVDGDTYKGSIVESLLEKLVGLSYLQQLALRDLTEQYWYMGSHETSSIRDFLQVSGLIIAEQQ